MNRSNIDHGIVEEVSYVLLMRMGNRVVVELMIIGTTSIEECGGRELAVV